MKQADTSKIKASEIFGGGYDEFLRARDFYRVCKGGRASKKSTTMGIECPTRIMKYPNSNILVVRQTANTHETSTYAEIQQGVERLGASKDWKFTLNPCEATYKKTGQKIYFRGFDDEFKLTSFKVPKGVLCWIWLEEAFEVDDKKKFDTMCEGVRGIEIPEYGLWPQVTLTYNPWINSHWTKTMFWDVERDDTFRITTTHKDNEFLSEQDHARIEALKDTDPERYLVVGLGEYGIPGGAYFDEFRKSIHVLSKKPSIPDDWRRVVTIDYGKDMLACYWIALDWRDNGIVYKELHIPGLFVSEAVELIKNANKKENGQEEKIYQWFAPSDLDNKNNQTGKSTLDLLREGGLPFMKVSNRKIDGCYNMREWLKPYVDEQGVETAHLVFSPSCENVIRCISQIQADEKDPNIFSDQPHELTHSVTAIMYFTAGRPRSAKKPEEEKYPINSMEYRVYKQLDRLTKKRRKTYW